MQVGLRSTWLVAASLVALGGCMGMQAEQRGGAAMPAQASSGPMSFFVTSAGPGRGGDLGGIEGADRHC